MNVTCPGCSTRYALPPHLLGPSGARICCPSCWLTFVLGPGGELAAVLGRAEPAEAPADGHANGAGVAVKGHEVESFDGSSGSHVLPEDHPALIVMRALDEPPGSLARVAAEGRLFAEHGAALLRAFEALEAEMPGADIATAFREALYEMTGVDLTLLQP